MDEDIQSQLERAKELLRELEKACDNDLQAKNVSGKTKNLSQEVLLKVRHLLDQAFYKFFEKYYLPNLSDSDKKSARVYFPIVSKKEDLKSVLSRAKMGDLETNYQDFYRYIDSIQPYNPDYSWLKNLAHYASEKHVRLTPQTRKEIKELRINSGGAGMALGQGASIKIGDGAMIKIGNATIPGEQNINVNNPAQFYGQGSQKIITWISFQFEDSNINVLQLCKKSVEDGEGIIKKILEYLQ